jgi:hypothetical protein
MEKPRITSELSKMETDSLKGNKIPVGSKKKTALEYLWLVILWLAILSVFIFGIVEWVIHALPYYNPLGLKIRSAFLYRLVRLMTYHTHTSYMTRLIFKNLFVCSIYFHHSSSSRTPRSPFMIKFI